MLLLIEYLGRGILAILLLTMTALKDAATVRADVVAVRKRIRLITGCLAIGLPLGFYLNGGFPNVLSAFPDPSSKTWVYFVGIPLLLIVLVLFLARLRKEFVD